MSSDEENVEYFNQAANNPRLWQQTALNLHVASQMLWEKSYEARSALREDLQRDPLIMDHVTCAEVSKYGGLVFPAAMLQAFAIECMLKCIWVLHGNRIAKDGEYLPIARDNHDFVGIAAAVSFPISPDERDVFVKLSVFARSFGRYPIAKKWHEQRLTTDRFGVKSAGPTWGQRDHEVAESVIARLQSAIDAELLPDSSA